MELADELPLNHFSQKQYKGCKYADNEEFCKDFRSFCVAYAGSIGEHHQLDCVFNQTYEPIRAWCGGIKKNKDGTWNNNSTQFDNTRAVIAKMGATRAKITRKPLTYKQCLAAKTSNKAVTCVA
ncbi:hypothetical protein T439DRAFT_224281 [Meredithblackwellia eburnea MCA 4105]